MSDFQIKQDYFTQKKLTESSLFQNNGQTHYTPKQLAERWQVSHITLACWRSKGSGPRYMKWGKTVRYTIEAIEEWEQRHTKDNTSQ